VIPLPPTGTAPGEQPVWRREVYLHAGQLVATPDPSTITTVLGSCVAVCLYDPRTRAGGANHYLLPHPVGDAASSARFGSVAVLRLIEAMLALGCRREDLRAKVFGGASLLGSLRDAGIDLGMRNAKLAQAMLAAAAIPVLAEDVGGERGRRLLFQTDDGTAWVRRL
jgi:chemotaxis protein CheD